MGGVGEGRDGDETRPDALKTDRLAVPVGRAGKLSETKHIGRQVRRRRNEENEGEGARVQGDNDEECIQYRGRDDCSAPPLAWHSLRYRRVARHSVQCGLHAARVACCTLWGVSCSTPRLLACDRTLRGPTGSPPNTWGTKRLTSDQTLNGPYDPPPTEH